MKDYVNASKDARIVIKYIGVAAHKIVRSLTIFTEVQSFLWNVFKDFHFRYQTYIRL